MCLCLSIQFYCKSNNREYFIIQFSSMTLEVKVMSINVNSITLSLYPIKKTSHKQRVDATMCSPLQQALFLVSRCEGDPERQESCIMNSVNAEFQHQSVVSAGLPITRAFKTWQRTFKIRLPYITQILSYKCISQQSGQWYPMEWPDLLVVQLQANTFIQFKFASRRQEIRRSNSVL